MTKISLYGAKFAPNIGHFSLFFPICSITILGSLHCEKWVLTMAVLTGFTGHRAAKKISSLIKGSPCANRLIAGSSRRLLLLRS